MSAYELRQFTLPADLEEWFTAALWALGALGFEVHPGAQGRLRLDAYFPVPPPPSLAGFDLAPWQRRGVEAEAVLRLAERDWLSDYRAAAEPFDVGRRFRVDPRDPVGTPPAAGRALFAGRRIGLRIPAQTAFGTGSHESTRLVLEWLEELDLGGLAVLDVGTGSGILSFAAELLGAGWVVGCDVDAQAVCVARANARLNGLAPRLVAGDVEALGAVPRFDLALVNILPENFLHQIPRLISVLKPGARLISSGNLASRREELLVRWASWGFELEADRRLNEWVAFLLRSAD